MLILEHKRTHSKLEKQRREIVVTEIQNIDVCNYHFFKVNRLKLVLQDAGYDFFAYISRRNLTM